MRGLALVFLLLSSVASAATVGVMDAWKGAVAHDPVFAAARAQRDAGRARGAESRALWLPTLAATGSVARSDLEGKTQGAAFAAPGFGSTGGVDFQTSVNGGIATRWAFTAQQPLFDAARLADSTGQKDAARLAEAQFHAAEQDLIVRSARAYFDVLNARAQLDALQRLHSAAERTRAEAAARYESGDIPATDMREAQASADAIGVQELDARSAVALSEAAFTDLTGLDTADLGALSEVATAELPIPDSLDTWIRHAAGASPVLTIHRLALTTATAQRERYGAFNSPQLSLVAQVGRDAVHGNGDFGAADITGRTASIGLQASIPLFTGGMRSAQRHEARALEQRAQAELDGADQQVRAQTRAAWLALTSAAARVQALQRLRTSTQSRLAATRLGLEIGGRNALELLNAEADALRAGADFQRAQSAWFLAGLQLQAMAGALSAADLESIDRRLSAPAPQSH